MCCPFCDSHDDSSRLCLCFQTKGALEKAKLRRKKPVAKLRHAVLAGTTEERKVKAMMHALRAIRNDKTAKRKAKQAERMGEMVKRKAADDDKRSASLKVVKRRRYALEGAKEDRAKKKLEASR